MELFPSGEDPHTIHGLTEQLMKSLDPVKRARAALLLGNRGAEARPVLAHLLYALRTEREREVVQELARAFARLARAGCPDVLEQLKATLERDAEDYPRTIRTALVAHVLEHAEAAAGRIA